MSTRNISEYESYDDAFDTLSKLLRSHKKKRRQRRVLIVAMIASALTTVWDKYDNKKNIEIYQTKQEESYIKDSIGLWTMRNNKTNVMYEDTINPLLNEGHIIIPRIYYPLKLNTKENIYKSYSVMMMDEFRKFKIPQNTLSRYDK